MRGKCEVEGCEEKAKFALYKTYPNGEKKWLHVCDFHEIKIGDENGRRAGGHIKGA